MKQTEYYAAKAKEMETEAKEIEVEAKAIETAKPEEAVAKRREAQRKRREAKRVTERLLPPPEAYEQWQENLEELEKTMDKLEAQHKRYREMIETGMYVSFSRRKELQHLFAERYDKRQEIIEQAKPELSLSEYTQQYLRLKEEYEKRHGGV
jgi:GTP1/Obg family GTP-binding protein